MSAPEPVAAQDHAAMLVANLATVDRIVAAIARRFSVKADDAAEFGSWVRERLVDRDYAVFRKFGGRSSITTYLTVVITNLYRDYRNSRWGRWRPSAAARHLGPAAIQLESLLYRDSLSERESFAILLSRGDGVTERELRRIRQQLPARTRNREVSLEVVGDAPGGSSADEGVVAEDQAAAHARTSAAMKRVLERLPAEEQAMLRMRFWDGYSVADIARALGREQKPLYRLLERLLLGLRAALEAEGITATALTELVEEDLT